MEAILANKIPKETKIALCGSTKYKNMFEYINRIFSLQGKLIYSLPIFDVAEGIELTTQEKMVLENVQRAKIFNSDCIFVINVDNCIDDIVKSEIMLAEILNKHVYYLTDYLN